MTSDADKTDERLVECTDAALQEAATRKSQAVAAQVVEAAPRISEAVEAHMRRSGANNTPAPEPDA